MLSRYNIISLFNVNEEKKNSVWLTVLEKTAVRRVSQCFFYDLLLYYLQWNLNLYVFYRNEKNLYPYHFFALIDQ